MAEIVKAESSHGPGRDHLASHCLLNRAIQRYDRRERSIAEQIHERLAQKLVGALLHIQACEHLEGCSEAGTEAFDTAKDALGEVIDEARRLVSQLRSPILDKLGVVCGIEYLIGEVDGDPNRQIEFLHPSQLTKMSLQIEIAAFQIVRELLTNACRHSRSKRIRIKLVQDTDRLLIEVQDWGIGFDPDSVTEGAFGLRDVRDRVALLGGQIAVDTAVGQGTQVLVELPLTDEEDFLFG